MPEISFSPDLIVFWTRDSSLSSACRHLQPLGLDEPASLLQIVTNMLSLSLSLASLGAVVSWDALDDMGNSFLMLGMVVRPPIRPEFA